MAPATPKNHDAKNQDAKNDNLKNDNLKSFSAYRDENGQGMTDAPNDRADPKGLRREMASDPGGEAETVRLASGQPVEDATEATEAEVPAENIAHISDATLPPRAEVAAALDRATASLGKK